MADRGYKKGRRRAYGHEDGNAHGRAGCRSQDTEQDIPRLRQCDFRQTVERRGGEFRPGQPGMHARLQQDETFQGSDPAQRPDQACRSLFRWKRRHRGKHLSRHLAQGSPQIALSFDRGKDGLSFQCTQNARGKSRSAFLPLDMEEFETETQQGRTGKRSASITTYRTNSTSFGSTKA